MALQTRVSRGVTCVCKVLCSYCFASLLELPHLADFVWDGVEASPAVGLPHVLRGLKNCEINQALTTALQTQQIAAQPHANHS